MTSVHESAEIDTSAVVLLGKLNPSIFQPQWFAAQGLISKQAADAARIQVIHQDVSIFEIDDSTTIEVLGTRAAFRSNGPITKDIIDLVAGTFQLLKHSPLASLGINRDQHHKAVSETAWHAFGDAVAPKSRWQGVLQRPGLRSLTQEGVRPDGGKGYIRVKVEPSVRIPHGIYIQVNDHFDVADPGAVTGAGEVMDLLTEHWQASRARTNAIIDAIIGSV